MTTSLNQASWKNGWTDLGYSQPGSEINHALTYKQWWQAQQTLDLYTRAMRASACQGKLRNQEDKLDWCYGIQKEGAPEKPRGQVGFSRLLQRSLYTTRHESLTNYWVSMNDYKLTCHVSINSTLIVLTEHNVISADIHWHINLIIELCWLKPNTAHNYYYPQCSMSFYCILTNQSSCM